jgi:hypothetical protein
MVALEEDGFVITASALEREVVGRTLFLLFSLTLMFLLVRSDRFQGALVHSLRTNVEPVLVELFVGHVCGYGSFFVLQPLFGPLAQVRVSV